MKKNEHYFPTIEYVKDSASGEWRVCTYGQGGRAKDGVEGNVPVDGMLLS